MRMCFGLKYVCVAHSARWFVLFKDGKLKPAADSQGPVSWNRIFLKRNPSHGHSLVFPAVPATHSITFANFPIRPFCVQVSLQVSHQKQRPLSRNVSTARGLFCSPVWPGVWRCSFRVRFRTFAVAFLFIFFLPLQPFFGRCCGKLWLPCYVPLASVKLLPRYLGSHPSRLFSIYQRWQKVIVICLSKCTIRSFKGAYEGKEFGSALKENASFPLKFNNFSVLQ